MQSSTNHKTSPRGFTLVELLTVIVIIGILAGLIVAAVIPAIRRAHEFTIRQEIEQLSYALEEYKNKCGDYPPDFAGVTGGAGYDADLRIDARNAVMRHFRKAFPRYTPGANIPSDAPAPLLAWKGQYQGLLYDISYATRSDPTKPGTGMGLNKNINLNPSTAMVLMLGGPPAPAGSSPKLRGFSANPANPFAQGGSRRPSFYEFDETRLVVSYKDGVPTSLAVLIPPHMPQPSSGNKAPYVYFRPRNRSYGLTHSYDDHELPYFCQSQEQGICTPYVEQASFDNGDINRWVEPRKYQIICAGLDGMFSDPELFNDPSDILHFPVEHEDVDYRSDKLGIVRILGGDYVNIAPQEDDNITSFTQGKLEDRPEE